MADVYLPIDGNQYYKHYNVTDDTNYELYFAILNAYQFLVTDGKPVTDPDYVAISSALEEAMKYEANIMDNSKINTVLPLLNSLKSVPNVDDRYSHLYFLFDAIVNLGYLYTSAHRITTLSKTSPTIPYSQTTLDSIGLTYGFNYKGMVFSVSLLELLNLQAGERLVPLDLAQIYIDKMDTNVPIENVLTYNLFNFQTFSNSELFAHTLLPAPLTSEAQSFKFLELIYAAEYFYKTHTEYITFDNYINFDTLYTYVAESIDGFKYLLDYIDSLTISDNRDVNAYYPSGKSELYAEMDSLRQTLLNLSMAFNIALLFKRMRDMTGNLTTILACLTNLETKLFTESNLVSALMAEYSIDETTAKDILYNGGTSSQIAFVNGLIEESMTAYKQCTDTLTSAGDLAKEAQQMSSSYTAVSQYYNETQFDWTNINSSINSSMGNINSLSSSSTTKLNSISGTLLSSYGLTKKLNSVFSLSLLGTLAALILAFNLLVRLASCALMAISCAAHFIASILSEIANLGNLSGIDFSQFSLDKLINSASDAIQSLSVSDMLSKTGDILAELASSFSPSELAKIATSLTQAINGIDLSCFMNGFSEMYNEVLEWVKASIAQGAVCKFKPPNLNKLKLNLGRNSLRLPGIDLRFKLRTCTGA